MSEPKYEEKRVLSGQQRQLTIGWDGLETRLEVAFFRGASCAMRSESILSRSQRSDIAMFFRHLTAMKGRSNYR